MPRVPDALSRITEDAEVEEIASFEQIKVPWYHQKLVAIEDSPHKFREWRVEENQIRFTSEKVLCDAHNETSSGNLGVEYWL